MKPSEPIETPQSKSASQKARRFTRFGLWLRVFIYNCVFGMVLLPIYNIERLERSAVKVLKLFAPYCTPHQIFAKSDIIPSFYTCKGLQSEAVSFIGATARAQKFYYANNLKFAGSIEALEIGLPLETNNYRFQMWTRPQHGPFDREVASPEVIVIGRAKQPEIRSYSGIVFLDGKGRPISQICETRKPAQDFPVLEMMSDFKTINCRNLDRNTKNHFK